LLGHGYYAGHRFGELALTEGEVNSTTDNAWLDVAVDLGVVGVVALLGFLASGVRALWRGLRLDDPRARPALVVLSVCIAASFVNPSLNEANYWALVAAFIVICVAPALGHRGSERFAHSCATNNT
jgi:O-antigen ligase